MKTETHPSPVAAFSRGALIAGAVFMTALSPAGTARGEEVMGGSGGEAEGGGIWGALEVVLANGGPWAEDAGALAEKLGMHSEMEDGVERRHIVYPPVRWKGTDFRILQRSPRAIMMTSSVATGRPLGLRVVFGNRGEDLWEIYKGEGVGDRPDDITEARSRFRKEMQQAIRSIDEDAEAIASKLTEMLGAPGWAKPRRDIPTGERRKRWQGAGLRVELSHSKGTITAIDISPEDTNSADQSPQARQGAAPPNGERRGLSSADMVVRDDDGDVFITGIPEVHQGDKPYCSAASLERLFRLHGVEVDQYELGAAVGSGDTQIGSGWRKLIDVTRGLARKNRISIENLQLAGRLDRLGKLIDDGTPLMWAQRSTPALTDMFWKLSSDRSNLEKPSRKRERKLGGEADEALDAKTTAHACLVVGYNSRTGEIAISNTWQGKSDLIWIPFEVFEAADHGADLVYLKKR